ncbi:MAG: MBL fold metallo-hydrolase, partial [Longimicrobiales bacterium]|nr:MBL fold metallo-hydrolase [Longimicrobiales bacterium]
MRLVFEQIRLGGDRNFGYLLGDREAGEALVVDPAYSPETLVERARVQGLRVTHVVNTHGHPDHINGNEEAVELTGAPVAGHRSLPETPGVTLAEGDELGVGAFRLRAMETPGHAADHLVLYEPEHEILITG